ncbi:hypothetical protein ACFYNO_21195 [Kitasatospora sp. NPDC006697]|uniref:hypothetical protein n=1 Tax=Kitasatospora sp. NPDC006697 TaxID=3364020 RepID=UPI0036933BFA
MLFLLLGLVAGLVTGPVMAAAPAEAAGTPPPGGMNPCLVLSVCIVITQPGSSTGGGGGSTGPAPTDGSTGTPAPCSYKGIVEPCWDGDLGYFDNDTGCYYRQADPGDPVWKDKPATAGTPVYPVCVNADGTLTAEPVEWLDKVPGVTAGPPPTYVVGQMAFNRLAFERPQAHTAPQGKSLLGIGPTFFWYDTKTGTRASEVGDLTASASLNGVTVQATAHVTSVLWDLGYQKNGVEQTVDCTAAGAGKPYAPGMEQGTPPAGSCSAVYAALSATDAPLPSNAPSPTTSAAPGGGFWPMVTVTWVADTDTAAGPGHFGPVTLSITSYPAQLQVNQLQVLN